MIVSSSSDISEELGARPSLSLWSLLVSEEDDRFSVTFPKINLRGPFVLGSLGKCNAFIPGIEYMGCLRDHSVAQSHRCQSSSDSVPGCIKTDHDHRRRRGPTAIS